MICKEQASGTFNPFVLVHLLHARVTVVEHARMWIVAAS